MGLGFRGSFGYTVTMYLIAVYALFHWARYLGGSKNDAK
jgi:hypothetical protein